MLFYLTRFGFRRFSRKSTRAMQKVYGMQARQKVGLICKLPQSLIQFLTEIVVHLVVLPGSTNSV